MKYICIVLLLATNLLWAQTVEQETYKPYDQEVMVAIQGIVVAAVATMGSQQLQPPVIIPESRFITESFYSYMALIMDHADVGSLIRRFLESPEPPPASDQYFVDMLRRSLSPFSSDYQEYLNFLQRQRVKEGEIIYSGKMDGYLQVETYPFFYDGQASFHVSGSRFSQPFILEFTFVIPTEGPYASRLVPQTLTANGFDFIHVARSLFTVPGDS
jgi:hypothetical protein